MQNLNTGLRKKWNVKSWLERFLQCPVFNDRHFILKSPEVRFSPRSRYRWSRSGGGFCQPGHRRVSRSTASPETWRSWGPSARWRATSQQCTPSHANLPGTRRWDYPEGNTRHPWDQERMFKSGFPTNTCFKKEWPAYAREMDPTLNCCCVTLLLSGFKNSRTWGIRSLQQKL